MGSILFEHNQKAYKAAVRMMEQTGKAAVIHPTGTGKSFIALQLCADRPESRILWISPSEYIFRTQVEKWNTACKDFDCDKSASGNSVCGRELKNIRFMTYAKLMRQSAEELAKIEPDYIILDEFHRCGAAQWGAGVERVREMYPHAKLLGLSATNIRYLDNQRDMAWEIFGGNIASELTLGAAVVQGILPAPKYVLSVYAYQKELQRYELRVRQARNKAVRDKAEKELEALRRALEKADGLPEIFARHMLAEEEAGSTDTAKPESRTEPKSQNIKEITDFGKYIVFCASYEHLTRMRELAPEWFAKVDTKPHIYTAYSDDPAVSEEFEAFKADQSGHLKLLYCIDMLNEGIHVEGLNGVILLRPTVSPTIYKQQIGRALAAGGKREPVIFDIVMNIENLCSIGAVEEELHEAVFASRANGRAEEIVHEHFQVIDETADCRKLFMQLNETLGASWEAMYAMAQEYYRAHGNLEIPAHYTTPDGYSLGAWLLTQRKVYAGKTAGNLSGAQIAKLNALGMRWQGAQEASWEWNFKEARKYYQENGNLEVPAGYVTQSGCRLGRWVRRQRELYREPGEKSNDASRQEKLRARKIAALEEIGMVWEESDSWEERFALAKQYYGEHGDLNMPADYVVCGVWLDRWLREQKARLREEEAGYFKAEEKKCNPLSPEQKEKLRSIGISSGRSRTELSWQRQYEEAEEFFREHGNLSIPKRYVGKSGRNLGIWLQRQRTGRQSGQLSGEQVALLDGIGMVWNPGVPWEAGFSHAREFFEQYGHLDVPNNYICADGYRLGKWISNQRSAGKGSGLGKGLGKEQVRRLEEIGMVWSAKAGRKEKSRKVER